MTGGFHGPRNDWKRLEAPLKTIDPALKAFAQGHGLSVSRNGHIRREWPERTLRQGADGPFARVIQISLRDDRKLTFDVWICAFEDRAGERYWKRQAIREAVTIPELIPELDAVLTAAFETVTTWGPQDLTP